MQPAPITTMALRGFLNGNTKAISSRATRVAPHMTVTV